MTVSKRTRFEVLRRDNHICRYCRSADNPLTVDHVTPVALGGSDNPDNLVAACKDCNAGKASAAPDGTLVADVREDALRHAEMIQQAYAVIVERMGERDDYIDEFVAAFPDQPVPANWRDSVGRWFEMGVPIEMVCDAARIALGKPQRFNGSERFKYLCGVVWNQVHAVNEAVELKWAILGSFRTDEEIDEQGQYDYQTGYRFGWNKAQQILGTNDIYHRALSSVVDTAHLDRMSSWDDWLTNTQLPQLRSVGVPAEMRPVGAVA